jgi:hypothetical protein
LTFCQASALPRKKLTPVRFRSTLLKKFAAPFRDKHKLTLQPSPPQCLRNKRATLPQELAVSGLLPPRLLLH